MHLNLHEQVNDWITRIAEQKEAFVAYHLFKHNLEPDDYVLTQWHEGTTIRIGLDRKLPKEKEVYVRDLEEQVRLLKAEVEELKAAQYQGA